MFRVPVVKGGENGHLRQRGKVAELALGYGVSVGALKAMDAVRMGVPEEELNPLVDMWREANPNIVQYWWAVDKAVKDAILLRLPQKVGKIRFDMRSGVLFITLPSGRRIAYIQPRIEENQFGGESVTYMGLDAQKHWTRLESYGPKFVENITQALCRDLLADAMMRLDGRYRIVAHVHDEVILEVSRETELEEACEIMGRTPDWLPGIELRADGFAAGFYRK